MEKTKNAAILRDFGGIDGLVAKLRSDINVSPECLSIKFRRNKNYFSSLRMAWMGTILEI
jgi:hypothetical protein